MTIIVDLIEIENSEIDALAHQADKQLNNGSGRILLLSSQATGR